MSELRESPRILFVTRAWPTGGGTEVWLESLVHGLRALGQHVDVAVAIGARHNVPEPFFAAHPSLADAHEIDGRSGWRPGRRLRVRELLERTEPDVVVPLRVRDALEEACSLKARRRFRIVYPLHEYNPGFFQDLLDVGCCVDRVVVCDELSRRATADLGGIDSVRLEMIPQGVSPGPRRSSSVRGVPVRLGFAGRIESSQKRVLDLIQICGWLREASVPFQLRIAGSGPEEQALRIGLETFSRSGEVEFVGRKTPRELKEEFYPHIDALLLTSSWETGPIVAWEAMSAGALLVTSRYRGLAAAGFLHDGRNCLSFEVGDARGAVDCIRRVVEDGELLRRIADQGEKDVRRDRSLDLVVRRWRDLFERVVGEPAIDAHAHRIEAPPSNASRLERLGLGPRAVEAIKRSLGREFEHSSPGEEWPFHGAPSADLPSRLEAVLARLDVALDEPVGGT